MTEKMKLLQKLCAGFVVVVLTGCTATAQEDVQRVDTTERQTAAPQIGPRRALQTRIVLQQQGLVRDDSATVMPAPCANGEEQLFDLAAPPVCEELAILAMGSKYRAFLFSNAHDVLVIYHEGHRECSLSGTLAETIFPDAIDLMTRLLDRADVLYLDMPLLATNCGQQVVLDGTVYSGISHNWFALVDRHHESALAYFFTHIHKAVDFLEPRYKTIHMTGRSGGGWATTVYAALDWRITRSVSVAGSLPIELRTPELDGVDDIGDWEQYGPLVFRMLKYQDLYEAAGGISEPRRHIQIYNEFDICCFKGLKGIAAADAYAGSAEGYMTERVQFLVNSGEREHLVPVDMVLESLFGS